MTITILKMKNLLILLAAVALIGYGCSSDKGSGENTSKQATKPTEEANSKNGVGPVKEVNLTSEIDESLAEKGKGLFESKCTACHKFEERYVGPALAGVTERREPAWIMNMIMKPDEMTQKDPTAKKLLGEYMTQMVNQNVTESDARAILEYFRLQDKN